jgi:hypothetical protein
VYVVEVFAFGAVSNFEVDSIGKVSWEIPFCPVNTMLFGLQRLAYIRSITMLVLARGFVKHINSPSFFAALSGVH